MLATAWFGRCRLFVRHPPGSLCRTDWLCCQSGAWRRLHHTGGSLVISSVRLSSLWPVVGAHLVSISLIGFPHCTFSNLNQEAAFPSSVVRHQSQYRRANLSSSTYISAPAMPVRVFTGTSYIIIKRSSVLYEYHCLSERVATTHNTT